MPEYLIKIRCTLHERVTFPSINDAAAYAQKKCIEANPSVEAILLEIRKLYPNGSTVPPALETPPPKTEDGT